MTAQLLLLLSVCLLLCSACAQAITITPTLERGDSPDRAQLLFASLPDAPDAMLPQTSAAQEAHSGAGATSVTAPLPEPKRILGIVPNYRAVSAGTVPPPPTAKEAFKIATQNSFDYSAFVFTGVTSLIAEGNDSHPQLGKGVPGFWAYSWRGFLDKTDGNYWVEFAFPSILREDERYYALGRGSILKRAVYSTSRVFVARDYQGRDTINGAELLGRGVAQGISTTYYPSEDRTASELTSKYAYSLLRDAATNAFREFWPDISVHLRRQP